MVGSPIEKIPSGSKIESYKAVQISYSRRFSLQNGYGMAWNTILSLLFSKEVKRLLLSISMERTAIFVEIVYRRVALASATLSDMHVVEVQVPFLSRHFRTPLLSFCSVPRFWNVGSSV